MFKSIFIRLIIVLSIVCFFAAISDAKKKKEKQERLEFEGHRVEGIGQNAVSSYDKQFGSSMAGRRLFSIPKNFNQRNKKMLKEMGSAP